MVIHEVIHGRICYTTPLTFNLRLDVMDRPLAVDRSTYLGKVGNVFYASYDRPNLTFPHNWFASFNQQRTLQHDQEAERTPRFMHDTLFFGMLYQGG